MRAQVWLSQGRPVPLEVIFNKTQNDAAFTLNWQTHAPSSDAGKLAASADIAIIVVGTSHRDDAEGLDRPFWDMPADQVDLIRTVTRANPRTIVVMVNGSPLEMASWQGAVPGIVEMSLPLVMRVFPHSKFGQFCSAQALLASSCTLVAGLFIDAVQHFCRDPDFAYRFLFVWSAVFNVLIAVIAAFAYRAWHRLGGDVHYRAPAAWDPSGSEEVPLVPFAGPQFRWLNAALDAFHSIMALSVVGVPILMWWMHRCGAQAAFRWFAFLVLPFSLVAWLLWILVQRGIRRDMERARTREALRNGIPHHGVLLIGAVTFFLGLVPWVFEVVWTVNLSMEKGAIVFGVLNVITNLLLTCAVWVLCRIERGRSTELFENYSAESIPADGRVSRG